MQQIWVKFCVYRNSQIEIKILLCKPIQGQEVMIGKIKINSNFLLYCITASILFKIMKFILRRDQNKYFPKKVQSLFNISTLAF